MADAGRPLSTEQTRLLVTLVGALSAGGDALVLSSIIARLGISETDVFPEHLKGSWCTPMDEETTPEKTDLENYYFE